MIIHDPPENLIYGTVDAVAVSFRPAQTSRVKRSGLARFSRVHKTQQIRKISILMRFTQRITQV